MLMIYLYNWKRIMEEQATTNPPEETPHAGFSVKPFLFWLFFVAFVGGGFYSGALSLPRTLGWVGAVVSSPFGQRALPFNIFPTNPEQAPDWGNQERVNILVMGVDRRPSEGKDAPTRTDVMMIMTLDPYSKSAGVLSIPRDLFVPIPVRQGFVLHDRINTANVYGVVYDYPGGGPALAKETVQYNFGVRIHYYLMVDFEGFKRLVDSIGGVDVEVEKPIVDYLYPTPDYDTMSIYIPEGAQHLDGERTLWYVRSRHQDSDFGRIHRQQQVLLEIRQRLLQLDMLPRLPQLWGEFKDAVQTDLSLSEILSLAKMARDIGTENIVGKSLEDPYVTSAVTSEGADVLLPNRDKVRGVIDEVFFDARKQQEGARIEVLNGTDTPGLATKTAQQLKEYGFQQITVGDTNGNPQGLTEIHTYSNKTYTAKLVASLLNLPKNRVITVDRMGSNPVDIQVILGADAQ